MDEDNVSTDSGIESDYSSLYTTVNSDNYQHRVIEGRRHHGFDECVYPLPNDDEEYERLCKLQRLCRLILGKNVIAPISSNATDIVDIGTGSGQWCVEVADEYTSAYVRGTDISPIQPMYVPRNCEFFVANLNEGLDFHDGSIDLLHSRILMAAMTNRQWPVYLQEVYRVLKPGTGWIQIFETSGLLYCDDDTVPEDAAIWEFQRYLKKKYEDEMGMYFTPDHLEQNVRNAGFVDIEVRKTQINMGHWGKDQKSKQAGSIAVDVWGGSLTDFAEMMTEYSPDKEKRIQLGKRVKAELESRHYHLYSRGFLILGRKPNIKS